MYTALLIIAQIIFFASQTLQSPVPRPSPTLSPEPSPSITRTLQGFGFTANLLPPNCASLASDYAMDSEELKFITLLNAYRQQNGLNTLKLSPSLANATAWMSRDMANTDNTAHAPDSLGRSYDKRLQDCQYHHNNTRENLAAGIESAEGVFDAWKNSGSHDANMRVDGVTVVGVSRSFDPSSFYGWFWALMLGPVDDSGTPIPTISSEPTQPPTPTPLPSPTPTRTPTATPTKILSQTPTKIPTPTFSSQPTATPTRIPSFTPTQFIPTSTLTPTKTPTPTQGGFCGDSICQIQESKTSCPIDCPITPTPSPTRIPNPTPTIRSASTTPSQTPLSPTATPNITPGPPIFIALDVGLPGVGNIFPGDNSTPKRSDRRATVFLETGLGDEQKASGTLLFQDSSYTGTVLLGLSVPQQLIQPGPYKITVKLDNTLRKTLSDKPIEVEVGETISTQRVELLSGDLNDDNRIDLADYNLLRSCFGNKICAKKVFSDFNEDGKVDEQDINIFLRSLSISSQGD